MLTSKELQGTGEDPLQRVLSRSNIFEQEAAVPEPGWHQLQFVTLKELANSVDFIHRSTRQS